MPEKYTALAQDEVEQKFGELMRIASNAELVFKDMVAAGLQSAYFSWTEADDLRVSVLGKTVALCRAMIEEQAADKRMGRESRYSAAKARSAKVIAARRKKAKKKRAG